MTRPLLLALALAGSAAAQPVAPSASGVRLAVAADDLRLGATDPAPVYTGAIATLFGTSGAFLGAGGSAITLLLVELVIRECSPFGCPDGGGDEGLPARYIAAYVAGGVAGAAISVRAFGAAPRSPYALLPDPGIESDDWKRALVGALVGTLPGITAALLIPPSEAGVEWIAVPIAQGLGAGIAVAL
ncbi:MAG: hypothetical protein AAF594_08050 [Bacteroidota bacterium]